VTEDTSPGNAASQQPRLGWMYQIWPTSVHRVSLRGSHPSEYVDALNQRVGNAILKMFDDLVAANPNATYNGWDPNNLNEVRVRIKCQFVCLYQS